ncbi:MAG: hypothetical protein WBN65_00605 [Gammaproteobacteria bacterium]
MPALFLVAVRHPTRPALDVGEELLNDHWVVDAGDGVQGCTNSAERMDARER